MFQFLCFFSMYGYHRDRHVLPHSFPTRRCYDRRERRTEASHPPPARFHRWSESRRPHSPPCRVRGSGRPFPASLHRAFRWRTSAFETYRQRRSAGSRSEEHTSELQSLMRISYAVFCLKKKKNKQLNTVVLNSI